MSNKVRVYEVAKQFGLDEQAVLGLLQAQGAVVRNRLSSVEAEIVERARRALERSKTDTVVEERIRPTVVRRTRVKPTEPTQEMQTPESQEVQVPTLKVKAALGVDVPAQRPAVEITSKPKLGTLSMSHEDVASAKPARVSVKKSTAKSQKTTEIFPEKETSSTEESLASSALQPASVEQKLHAPLTEVVQTTLHVTHEAESVSVENDTSSVNALSIKEATTIEPTSFEAVEASFDKAQPASVVDEKTASLSREVAAPASTPHVIVRAKKGIETWQGRPGVPMPQPTQPRTVVRDTAPSSTGRVPQRAGVQYDPKADSRQMGRSASSGSGGSSRSSSNNRSGAPSSRGGGYTASSVTGRGRQQQQAMNQAAAARKPAAPSTIEMAAHKKIIKIDEQITLNGLAQKMGVKATDVLMKLLALGVTGKNINSTLDSFTAKALAYEFGWEVTDVSVSEDERIRLAQQEAVEPAEDNHEPRPPVITVMGHVDHGKTSLLDYIRKAKVAAGEAGGITQHIGAYKVSTSRGQLTFLDTPGHEAFTQMRARGASVTDIVVLVVAADDGVMPQTREAVAHAKAAKVPIVVAVNKIDKPEADSQRIRRELMDLELVPEDYGGSTAFIEVSAKTGKGIDELLDRLSLESEILELKANSKRSASGSVLEAMLDRGKGPVARILVRNGTLNVGDILLAGSTWGKVRAMTDETGRSLATAGPSTPVEVLGLNDVPNAGDPIDVLKDARKAQEISDSRAQRSRQEGMRSGAAVTLEELQKQFVQSGKLDLAVIIKADVQGSCEALSNALEKLSGDKVKVTIIYSGVGAITENDVNLAAPSKAIIIGFNVRPAGKASSLAGTLGIEIRLYNIIYDVVDDVRKAMAGLLAPTLIEKFLGRADVRQVFNISKVGVVAGCMVIDGTMKRTASKARLVRDSVVVWEGKLSGLKHGKEHRKEIEKDTECGISLENYNDIKPGDKIECYEVEEVATTL